MTPRSLAAGSALTLCALLSSLAPADPGAAEVSVGSDGARVGVSGYRAGGEDHLSYEAASSGPRLICRELVSDPSGMAEADAAGTLHWPPLDPTRQARYRYWLDCRTIDGVAVALADGGLGYVYADQIIDIDALVRTLAQRYAAEQLAPAISVATSPPLGLVGVEQWFWVGGYDGSDVTQTHDVVGHTVVLTVHLTAVDWDFGDGTGAALGADGLGRAGQRGASTHRYQQRSTTLDAQGAFNVSARLRLEVGYTLDGAGPFVVDPPLQAAATTAVIVREAQAVVHR